MGMDLLQMFSEVKIKDEWHYYREFKMGVIQDPFLFAYLGWDKTEPRFKRDITPVTNEMRGFPLDASFMLKACEDYCGGSNVKANWLNSDESISLLNEYSQIFNIDTTGYLFGNYYKWFYKYRDDYPPMLQDFRFVYWFY